MRWPPEFARAGHGCVERTRWTRPSSGNARLRAKWKSARSMKCPSTSAASGLVSMVVQARAGEAPLLVTKGALDRVIEVCGSVQTPEGVQVLDEAKRAAIRSQFEAWSAEGSRVVGVATKVVFEKERYSRADGPPSPSWASWCSSIHPSPRRRNYRRVEEAGRATQSDHRRQPGSGRASGQIGRSRGRSHSDGRRPPGHGR